MDTKTTPANIARSLYGCWTCRLRRKKCDETHPSCSTCTSLELKCHGYGSKPEWMDKGTLQREQALKVKRILSESKTKRRKQTLLQMTQRLQDQTPEAESSPSEIHFSPAFPLLSATHRIIGILDDNGLEESLQSPINEADIDLWENTRFPTEISFDHDASMPVSSVVENESYDSNPIPSGFSEGMLISNLISTSAHDADARWDSEFSNAGTHMEANLSPLLGFAESTADISYQKAHSPEEAALIDEPAYKSFPPTYSSSTLRPYNQSSCRRVSQVATFEETEDALFMHYLDHVFHIQFPFYHSSGRQGRGWLLSIFRRSKSAYYAALALSELFTRSEDSNLAMSRLHLKNENEHHDLALREMQLGIGESYKWSVNRGLNWSIEALTSILQLLFLELFAGKADTWKLHLRAAAAVISALEESQTPSIILDWTVPRYEFGRNEETFLLTEADTAIKFLVGSFISLDIISCASTRSPPLLKLDHIHALEYSGIHLETLTGCENWAMILIFKISQLDDWKRTVEKAQKLSMVELVKRGGQIEESLQEGLVRMKTIPSLGSSLGSCTSSLPLAPHIESTEIFALAATIYLHVVISGAHPELPEISRSVSTIMKAFQRLTDKNLLRNLVWPFCISGCLALEGQQGLFRELISLVDISHSTTFGTFSEAIMIMEECWETRKTSACNDWVSAMNKRGYSVLLR